MAREDIIMISQREIKRLHVIHEVLDKRLKQVEAGDILQLSSRQIRRIVKRISVEGDGGIGHKTRSKASNRRLPKKIKEKVIRLYKERYKGFGPTLAVEKLEGIEGIKISKETLRNWLIESGDWEKVRRGRIHLKWRERKGYIGEMIQMDGSHHDWLEGRGPELVLMAYIDDATNRVYARFYDYEGTIPAM
ncbi:MAG: helix-turn-helix domain-containing protein, partial [Nitrospinae bacterium]|nr:helix-turn-helix domain-containing protein [Nitrospinota bacterium]